MPEETFIPPASTTTSSTALDPLSSQETQEEADRKLAASLQKDELTVATTATDAKQSKREHRNRQPPSSTSRDSSLEFQAEEDTPTPSSRSTRCNSRLPSACSPKVLAALVLVVLIGAVAGTVSGLSGKNSDSDSSKTDTTGNNNMEFVPDSVCEPESIFCAAQANLDLTSVSRQASAAATPEDTCDCVHKTSLLVPVRTEKPNEAWSSSIPNNPAAVDGVLPSTQGRVANTTAQENLRPPVHIDPALLNGTRPIPTNVWWGNLIYDDSNVDGTPSNPIFLQPYRVQFRTEEADFDFNFDADQHVAGLHVSHPYQYRVWGHTNENNATAYFYHWFNTDLVLSAPDLTPSSVDMLVTDWDDAGFGVKAGIYHKNNTDSYFETHLTHGMAMITAEYHSWTPSVLLPERTILSMMVGMNEDPVTPEGTVTADKLILELDNDQHWVVYTSEPVLWSVSETGLTAADVFDGTLRVAKLPSAQATTVYDAHRDCIVTGAELIAPDSSHYAIQWRARGTGCAANGILHFALPHHETCLAGDAVPLEGLVLPSTTRGDMQAYVSRSGLWRFEEVPDHDVGFLPPNPLSPEIRDQTNLTSILENEITEFWDVRADGSYYYNGKAVQKYATLCLLAQQTTGVVADDGALFEICLSKLKAEFEIFVDNTWVYPLVYDEVYGGIVSSEGFLNNNAMSDFGNAVYNDHHYHWGYWIVASSILRHLSPDWDRMDELSAVVELLIRDVANPSSNDPWFPMFRQFDWYMGHSLSRGVTPSVDGKDQESVSEEMNLHYGLLLWGRVSSNPSLEQLGQLMLKVDARAIQSYFLFTSDNEIHPESILPNKVSGILSDNKITYSTWFCNFRECIHGIQMLPVSPINPIFRSDRFIQEEWADVLSKLPVFEDNPTSTWLSLMFVNLAHVDPATALEQLPSVSLDGGLSRSWATYYAAVQADPRV